MIKIKAANQILNDVINDGGRDYEGKGRYYALLALKDGSIIASSHLHSTSEQTEIAAIVSTFHDYDHCLLEFVDSKYAYVFSLNANTPFMVIVVGTEEAQVVEFGLRLERQITIQHHNSG